MSKLTKGALSSLFVQSLTLHTDAASTHTGNYTKGNFLVFDKETKLLLPEQNIYSSPPEFVLGCWRLGYSTYYQPVDLESLWNIGISNFSDNEHGTLVGHNICFDLNPINLTSTPLIWDTALAHYMMTGQSSSFPSLEEVAKYYGLGTKENTVSEMIKQGICPSVIPREQLKEYCEQDVRLTEEVYKIQIELLLSRTDKRLLVLICQMMEWLYWTHKASMTGITVNRAELAKIVPTLQTKLNTLEVGIMRYMTDRLSSSASYYDEWELKSELSVTSPKQINTMLFGGDVDGYVIQNTGTVYKSGLKKGMSVLKKQAMPISLSGLPGAHRFRGSTDEKNLTAMLDSLSMQPEDREYIEQVLAYRDMSKTLNTYLESYLDKSASTGKIHPQYKHVGTPTGRLSCTNPNIQNLKGD